MNDKQKEAHIAALLRERRGCEQYGLTERVEAIDRELARLGQRASTPVKRAERRTGG